MIAAMIDERTYSRIVERLAQLEAWLEEAAPYAQFDQRHLEAHTPEQAYWHLGYHRALSDVVGLINDETGDSAGTASPSPPAGSDE